jgi:hypothetical protein
MSEDEKDWTSGQALDSVTAESWDEEDEDPMVCRQTEPLPPIPLAKKHVRVSSHEWKEVDDQGRCVHTGEKLKPWVKPPLRMKSLTKKPRAKKKPKIHPKFNLRSSIITINSYADPNGSTWSEREPYPAYNWAREEFHKGTSLKDIQEKTGWSHARLVNWAYESVSGRMCWKEERQVEHNKIVRAVLKNTQEECVQSVKEILNIVAIKIAAIDEHAAKELSVKEVKDLVSVAEDLHKISQIEAGKPTNISANVKLTRESVLEKLKASDPYVNYDELEKPNATKEPTPH